MFFDLAKIPARMGLLAVFLLVSACASPGFRADVKRFHNLPEPRGESVAIEPLDGNPTLEYQNYAALLADNLTQAGYKVTDRSHASLVADLGFESHPDPGYHASSGPMIGIGVGGGGNNVGAGMGATFDTSRDSDIYFLHTAKLIIVKAGSGETVYEGTSSGHSASSSPAGVMGVLLDALFKDWPGESGKSQTIRIDQ